VETIEERIRRLVQEEVRVEPYDDRWPRYAWFIKRDAATRRRTHHIHMVEDHFVEHWTRLRFRDYLIDHPEIAQEYGALKTRLASAHQHDRVAYTRAKSEFIDSVTARALKNGTTKSRTHEKE